jgi:predicted secreted acid phosphatase
MESMHQLGAPDKAPFMADKATYYNRKELPNQLLPHAKWDQMSGDEKTVLYQKYNADHDNLKGFRFGKG